MRILSVTLPWAMGLAVAAPAAVGGAGLVTVVFAFAMTKGVPLLILRSLAGGGAGRVPLVVLLPGSARVEGAPVLTLGS